MAFFMKDSAERSFLNFYRPQTFNSETFPLFCRCTWIWILKASEITAFIKYPDIQWHAYGENTASHRALLCSWGPSHIPSPQGPTAMLADLKIRSTLRFPYSIQLSWWACILQVDIPHQLPVGSTNNNMCRTIGLKHSISQKQQMKWWQQQHLQQVIIPAGDRHPP